MQVAMRRGGGRGRESDAKEDLLFQSRGEEIGLESGGRRRIIISLVLLWLRRDANNNAGRIIRENNK
jgi:hypothetical protein